MKKVLLPLVIAGIFTACNNQKGENADEAKILSATSPSELAEFQQWKKQKENNASGFERNATYKNTPAPAASQTTTKKGWSKAAKGAVIGAGAGAIAGAVINKRNRAVGAVIGGVVGGGVGYGIGRSIDKKDGRY